MARGLLQIGLTLLAGMGLGAGALSASERPGLRLFRREAPKPAPTTQFIPAQVVTGQQVVTSLQGLPANGPIADQYEVVAPSPHGQPYGQPYGAPVIHQGQLAPQGAHAQSAHAQGAYPRDAYLYGAYPYDVYPPRAYPYGAYPYVPWVVPPTVWQGGTVPYQPPQGRCPKCQACLNQHGVGCYSDYNEIQSGSFRSTMSFIFGSSRSFFMEGCVPNPPHSWGKHLRGGNGGNGSGGAGGSCSNCR